MLGRVPFIDKLRLVSTGTEATMTAIRLARGFTGRPLLIKFAGHYHGHSDSLLAEAGSGLATLALPGSAGVTEATAAQTLVLWGEHDAVIPPADGERMRDAIPGARLQVIPGAYHTPMVDRAEAFNEALLAFLDAP